MTKFEEFGVLYQENSYTKQAAIKNFEKSCKACCCRNMQIDCNKCAIAYKHKQMIEYFEVFASHSIKAVPFG